MNANYSEFIRVWRPNRCKIRNNDKTKKRETIKNVKRTTRYQSHRKNISDARIIQDEEKRECGICKMRPITQSKACKSIMYIRVCQQQSRKRREKEGRTRYRTMAM